MTTRDPPYAFTEQELLSHLQNTHNYSMKFATVHYLKIVQRRLFVVSEGALDPPLKKLGEIIQIASLFHDIGKVAEHYQNQKQLRDRCQKQSDPKQRKFPTFFLHEVPSAVVVDRIARELGWCFEESFLASFSVLNHHNSMRPFGRIMGEIRWLPRGWVLQNRWTHELLPLCKRFDLDTAVLKNVTFDECEKYMLQMKNIISNRNLRWPKLYSLVLNPVVAGDNIDAKSRNDGTVSTFRKVFVKELEEAMN